MCGRYVSASTIDELVERYAVDSVVVDEPLPPRWNVAPTDPVYVVAAGRSGERRLGTMRWGLVPSWARDRSGAARMINARAETVAVKPAFRRALTRRRCVLPADSFWEWRVAGRGRQPYAIHRRGGPLAFAGLWDAWRDPAQPANPPVRTAAIVTTSANDSLRHIHERMPVVLDAAAASTWLDPRVEDPGALLPLLLPAPDDGWESWPVGPRVNAVANDGPELLEPLAGPEWPAPD
ncbi:MAG: SOS response-associated peptidase [Actinomycetota bacterium]|nr:SOS response-associated peptidase [Actinomycetota bacterium]